VARIALSADGDPSTVRAVPRPARRSRSLVAAVALGLAGPAAASPTELFGLGGRSPALAGAGVADAEAYDAAYLNPAGLADLRRRHVAVGYQIGDIDLDNLGRAVGDFGVETVPLSEIHKQEVDVFAPCALGGVINDDTISEFNCKIIAGAANNQLARPEHGDKLRDLGILYAPDFVINAGGLINVEDELRGYDRARAMQKVEQIYKQLQLIFAIGRERGISTAQAATEFAEERIRKISRIRLVRVTEYGPLSAHQ